MRISSVESPAPRDTWMRAARSDPSASGAQLPEWADSVIEHGHWHDSSRAYTLSSGREVVVPMVAKRLAGVAVAERAWPEGWSFASPLAEDGVRDEELKAIVGHLASSDTPSLAVRFAGTIEEPGTRNSRVTKHSTHVLDLAAGFDAWSAGISASTRKAMRRAEAEGLDISAGNGAAQVEAFAVVNRSTVDRWARDRHQPLPIARALAAYRDRPGRLATMIRHCGDGCRVWVARRSGVPVAAVAVVYGPAIATSWMSAIDKGALGSSGASLLLKKHIIAEACARGTTAIDLGESDPGSGMEYFKERVGAIRQPVSEFSVGLRTNALEDVARRALSRTPV